MNEEKPTSEESLGALESVWISNNSSFLLRYWYTAGEALRKVASDPESFAEFRQDDSPPAYVESVIETHIAHHNYSGVLLAYSVFDEFMASMTSRLGRVCEAPIPPNDLRDRGVKRHKKYVHRVCRVPHEKGGIDWAFLEDFATVRNAIIHANGNASLVQNRSALEAVVARQAPRLAFRHSQKLVVEDEFVIACMSATRNAALAVNTLATQMSRPKGGPKG